MGRRNSSKDRSKREASDFATDSEVLSTILRSSSKPRPIALSPTFNLTPISDLRTWHPQPKTRGPGAVPRAAAQLVAPKPKASPRASKRLPHTIGFKQPAGVLVCIRRKTRKQVLFAKKLTRSYGRKRRNQWSSVKC